MANGWRNLVIIAVRACERHIFSRRSSEKSRGMRATPDVMQTAKRAGQDRATSVPFSVSVIVVCVIVAAVVNVASFTNVKIGAHASVSFYAPSLSALLLTCLTLTCLARLAGLQSLVGLSTRLAISTA